MFKGVKKFWQGAGSLYRDLAKPILTTPKRTSRYGMLGGLSTAIYGGFVVENEKDARLTGTQRFTTFSDMLVNNPIVSASLYYFLELVGKAQWTIKPALEDSEDAKKMAEFVHEMLFDDPETSWQVIMKRASLAKFWGFSIQEWTAKRRMDGTITIGDIALRAQKTIERWDVDDSGRVIGVVQRSQQDGSEIYLPRKKLLYLTDNSIHDSPRGEGLFRMVVKPVFRIQLYEKLESIGYETDLNGIPIARAPLTAMMEAVNRGELTEEQANELVEGLVEIVEKRNKGEKAQGALLDAEPFRTTDERQNPVNVRQFDIELLQGNSKYLHQISEAIKREDRRIARVFGTEELVLGDTAGSYSLADNKSHKFLLSVDSQLAQNARAIRRDIIKPIFRMNGIDEKLIPELIPESVRFRDIQQVAQALTALTAAGLHPKDPAWNEVRSMAGISPIPDEIVDKMEEDAVAELEMMREQARNTNTDKPGGVPSERKKGDK